MRHKVKLSNSIKNFKSWSKLQQLQQLLQANVTLQHHSIVITFAMRIYDSDVYSWFSYINASYRFIEDLKEREREGDRNKLNKSIYIQILH